MERACPSTALGRSLAYGLVLLLGFTGCAGGQPRMLGTSAASAEDAVRLRAMAGDCVPGAPRQGDITPLVTLTKDQAAEALMIYLKPYYAGAATDLKGKAEAMAQCLRTRYGLPVEASQILNTGSRVISDGAVAAVLGNMGALGGR